MHGSIVPKAGKNRDRTLSDSEVIQFWRACDTGCAMPQTAPAHRLPPREIGKLRRSEISDDASTITIPAARSKNGKPHMIPLPPLAREILRSVQTTGEFVFTTTRGKPIAAWSRIKAELDALLKFSTPWVLHDTRRTFSTGLNKIGIAPEVVEACLNHISGSKGGVAGVHQLLVMAISAAHEEGET